MAEPTVPTPSSTPTPEERAAYVRDHVDFEEPDEPAPAPAAKPAVSSPSPEATTTPAPKHTHTSVARRAALEVGMAEEDIDSTPKDDLWEYIRYQQDTRDREARNNAHATRTAPSSEQEPSAVPARAEPGKTAPVEANDWGDDADVIDPEVRGMIEKYVAAKLAPFLALNADVGHLKNHVGRQVQETRHAAIDKMFAEFGPEAEAVYGKGRGADLKPDSPEMVKRLAVLDLAEKITKAQGDKQDYRRAFNAAHKLLFAGNAGPAPTDPPAPAPAARPKQTRNSDGTFGEVDPEVEEWERAAVSKPTNRIAAPARGIKAAKSEFEQGLAELASRNGQQTTGDDEEF